MNGAVKVFNAITLIFLAILIFWLTQINYQNLTFKENRSAYLGIASILLMVFAIQMIKRSIAKNHQKKQENDGAKEVNK
jgi:uncharacterized membrane protein